MAAGKLIFPFLAWLAMLFPFSGPAAADSGGSAVLHGRILDMAAEPVAGAEVRAFASDDVRRPADFASPLSEVDGLYRVVLPAGRYWLVAVARAGASRYGPLGPRDRHSGAPQVVELDPGEDLEMDFTVMTLKEAAIREVRRNQALVRVSGRILGADGVPVALACALADRRARPSGIPAHVSAWSDADGAYVLYLPKGRMHLGPSLGFPPESGYSLPLEIELDRDVTGVDLVLPAGAAPEDNGSGG